MGGQVPPSPLLCHPGGFVANDRQDGPELALQLPESTCVMIAYRKAV